MVKKRCDPADFQSARERAPRQNKIWLWTAVDHFKPGILEWVIGARSSQTFQPLWDIVSQWKCYFYVTDGWKVYPKFIKSLAMLKHSIRLLIHYLRWHDVPVPYRFIA